MGVRTRAAIFFIAFSAHFLKSATLKTFRGGTKSIQWCGTPLYIKTFAFGICQIASDRLLSGKFIKRHLPGTLPVPILSPLYTCRESAEMISPPNRLATATANSDFPEAVGPTITTILSFDIILLI